MEVGVHELLTGPHVPRQIYWRQRGEGLVLMRMPSKHHASILHGAGFIPTDIPTGGKIGFRGNVVCKQTAHYLISHLCRQHEVEEVFEGCDLWRIPPVGTLRRMRINLEHGRWEGGESIQTLEKRLLILCKVERCHKHMVHVYGCYVLLLNTGSDEKKDPLDIVLDQQRHNLSVVLFQAIVEGQKAQSTCRCVRALQKGQCTLQRG